MAWLNSLSFWLSTSLPSSGRKPKRGGRPPKVRLTAPVARESERDGEADRESDRLRERLQRVHEDLADDRRQHGCHRERRERGGHAPAACGRFLRPGTAANTDRRDDEIEHKENERGPDAEQCQRVTLRVPVPPRYGGNEEQDDCGTHESELHEQ